MNYKFLGLIGLCKKAGRLEAGETAVKQAMHDGKVYLVLMAQDTGPSLARRITLQCIDSKVRLLLLDSDKDTISRAIGRKKETAVMAITDEGLANALLGHLETGGM